MASASWPSLRQDHSQAVVRAGVVRPFDHRVPPQGDGAAVIVVAPLRETAQPRRQHQARDDPAPAAPQRDARHAQRDHRGQRQVHPMFDDHLDPAGNDTGRGEDREKPSAEKARHRPAPERHQRRHPQRHHEKRIRRHHGGSMLPKGAIFKDQRVRPHRQPQIAGDRLELRQPVRHGRDADVEAGRAVAIPARTGHQPGLQQPGGRQRPVPPAPPPPGLPEGAGHKRAVIKQQQHRRHRRHLLRRRTQHTGRDRASLPPPRPRRVDRADEAIENQQEKQGHQRLDPLDDIGHRLDLQRVQAPQEGDDQRHRQGLRPEPFAQHRPQERAPHQPEQRQAGEEVNEQVERVVAPDPGPAHRVIDRQREVGQRPARDRFIGRGPPGPPERPQLADRGVLQNGRFVIKNERAGETVVIGNENRADDHRRRQGDPPARRGRNGRYGHRRRFHLDCAGEFCRASRPRQRSCAPRPRPAPQPAAAAPYRNSSTGTLQWRIIAVVVLPMISWRIRL